MDDILIDIDEKQLESIADYMHRTCDRLQEIESELERLHQGFRQIWQDNAVEEFSEKYEKGMDSLLELLVAAEAMETLFRSAAEGYTATDKMIQSL